MSASRTVRFASSSKKEDSDEDYDSEEERYERTRLRLLKKVEDSASALRTLSKITRPIVTGAWRVERDEKYQRDEESSISNFVNTLLKSKENKPHSSTANKATESRSDSWDEPDIDKPKPEFSSRRISMWSPVKHVKTTDVSAVLEMEKTPTFKPLRKSKARLSMALLSVENACRSPSICDDDESSFCKTLPDCDLTPNASQKATEDHRFPLRAVTTPNLAPDRRKSIFQSFANEATPCVQSSGSDALPSIDISNVASDLNEKEIIDLKRENSLESIELEQQTPSRTSSFDSVEGETPISRTRGFMKSFKSPVRCSPVLRQAFGEEFSKVRGSIGSPDKLVNLEECTNPKDPSSVLRGLVTYVEVRRGEDDRTGGFRWKLKELGATVSDTLNKKVTHCVFQEGLLSTYRKAKQIGMHIVSPLWVMACDESLTRVEEARYPIEKEAQYELADPLQKCIKRPKIMSPDLGSGRDDKLLSRRRSRKSMKVDSPLVKAPPPLEYVIKTPSPLKTSRFSKRLSPSSGQKPDGDSDDDWDGFLAMVEAQVREKAASRRETGVVKESPVDFETRLQQLLGRCDEKTVNSNETKPPLASIFERGKVSDTVPKKTSPKKMKKPRLNMESGRPNSIMLNWLQRCSPEPGKRDCTPVSAAEAASAAADEILNTMFRCRDPKPEKKVNASNTPAKIESVKAVQSSQDSKELFVYTAKTVISKTAQPVKKSVKRSKLGFQGSAASSGALRNWLSGAKSPSPPNKCDGIVTITKESDTSDTKEVNRGDSMKRKASSFEEILFDDSFEATESYHQKKKHHGEVTPMKSVVQSYQRTSSSLSGCASETPTKESTLSTTKTDKKKTLDLTPRRRSLRLTPVKSSSQAGSITQLETLEESKESTFFSSQNLTPKKQATQHASKARPVSARKSVTPSKYTKPQQSERTQHVTVKSSVYDALFC